MYQKKIILLLAIMLCSYKAYANPNFNLALGLEHSRQTFEANLSENLMETDAQIDTVTLAPALHWQNWSMVISLPWQQVQGEYFINPTYPVLSATCNLISNLNNVQKLILVNRGTINLEQIQQCNGLANQTNSGDEDASGLNDVELFVSYYPTITGGNLESSYGMGFKFDNGDDQKGFGSGTQDIFVEASWLYRAAYVSLNANLGYNFVVKNNTNYGLSDYGYTWLGTEFPLFTWLKPGLEYHFQQSISDAYDDLDYCIGYLSFSNQKRLGGRIFYTDYLDHAGYPDQELGASIHYVF